MRANLWSLAQLFWSPQTAIAGILDRGGLLFASLLTLGVSLLLQFDVQFRLLALLPTAEQVVGEPAPREAVIAAAAASLFTFYVPLLALAAIYVPGLLLLASLIARTGPLRTVFSRDYSPLLACAATCWSAAHLPLALLAWLLPPVGVAALALLTYLYFAILMVLSLRIVCGAGTGAAVVCVALSWLPPLVAAPVAFALAGVIGWLASPLFLLWAWYYLGADISRIGDGFRRRQSFRRMLEAATTNPHDGDAQYQIGLIHQQRRQYAPAVERFQRAIQIDPRETDAHFQLGRIAREQGRLKDALQHYQDVINLDESHSQSEILRELGLLYLLVRQYQDALNELAVYVERRPYDPEGLFYWGQALEGTGQAEPAKEAYRRAMEAARTAPHYRRHLTAPWSRQAQKQLRKLG